MTKKLKFISTQEAADLTGLSEEVLRRGVKSGRFAAIKAGGNNGKYLFDEAMLLKTLEDEALSRVEKATTVTKKVRFIGIQEAADLTGLSVTTLRQGVESDRFVAIKSGGDSGKYLFDEAMLLKTLEDESLSRVKDGKRRSYLASLFKKEEDEEINPSASFTIK